MMPKTKDLIYELSLNSGNNAEIRFPVLEKGLCHCFLYILMYSPIPFFVGFV